MGRDDPLFGTSNSDKTVFRPLPGGRRAAGKVTPNVGDDGISPSFSPVTFGPEAKQRIGYRGLNPLVSAASVLLSLNAQLQGTVNYPDSESLRQNVIQQVRAFESSALARGATLQAINPARYALCSLLDETVLNTPWGHGSTWHREGLLTTFYHEAQGGENFFKILDQARQDPEHNLDLLELLALCLSMGFGGKYKIQEGGQNRLADVYNELLQTIRMQRGEFERALSPNWRGIQDTRNPLVRYVPLWVVAAVSSAVLIASFVTFLYLLNDETDPVFEDLRKIGRQRASVASSSIKITPRPRQDFPRLGILLKVDINNGLIAVNEQPDKTTLIIRGEGLFRSGSTVPAEAYHPLLIRIAEALAKVPGQITVIGHTDNIPVHSLRFRNNWELSRARATAISEFLAQRIGSSVRLTVEGRADKEPLVPNDSPKNRARNRRVEIEVSRPGPSLDV
jgi:type VI secretion system protein ImpK